jgi:hypothetical protein
MVERAEVFFDSGGVECAAYLYGSAGVNGNVPCVVIGPGTWGCTSTQSGSRRLVWRCWCSTTVTSEPAGKGFGPSAAVESV